MLHWLDIKYLPFHMKPVEIGLYGKHEPAIFHLFVMAAGRPVHKMRRSGKPVKVFTIINIQQEN